MEARAHLHTRTAELKEAETFLSLADEVPETEIVRIVQQLNSSIFQVAAAIADDPRFSSCSAQGKRVEQEASGSWLDAPLLFAIQRSATHGSSASVIQVALQGAMVKYVHWNLASCWDLKRPGVEGDRLVQNLYRRIEDKGMFRLLWCRRTTLTCV